VGLTEDLGRGPVGLDTAVFVYFIEEHPDYLPLVEPVLAGIDQGRWQGVTSALTLLETLVVPYRAGNVRLADQYESYLTRGRGLHLVDLARPLLRAAALLRARFRVRTPDALQLAAALAMGCSAFVTNDRRLPEIPGLRILALDRYRRGRSRPQRPSDRFR
jgi:predicted nucleic acid-binding protein